MTTERKRILLFEDDRFLRRACEVWLRQRGYEVTTASDGAEGLALARAGTYDVILLDLLMPRMSGLDVLDALRREPETKAVPVLVLSNSSREQDVAHVMRLGAEFIVKATLSLGELTERLARLLDHGAGTFVPAGAGLSVRGRTESDPDRSFHELS
jgi:DNA-binding response OmpR family regulator